MTLIELVTILKSTGYPVAYSHFKKTPTSPVPNPPFICYTVPYSSNMFADNRVYQKISHAQVELYTDKKDLIAESTLENVLEC